MSGMDFSKWLNNIYIPNNPEFLWIKNVSSKSVKQSIMNADRAYKRFFKGQASFPRFKKKGKSDVKIYFVKTDEKVIIPCDRHRIKIPTLGWVSVKEKGYLPTNPMTHIIKSGTVSCKAGRYYVSILVEENPVVRNITASSTGIGIDLGLKDFAIISDGSGYKNINKTAKLKKLEKKLKREQRCLSRKYEDYKKRSKTKGEATRHNIQKQIAKVQKLHSSIEQIRTNYINTCIAEIVKTKPFHITVEDLNVSGMMKNRHLSKTVASQKFYEFRNKLQNKCNQNGIELRIADMWFPSSKLCHNCGQIKKDLKLSDRIYRCDCVYTEDRDYNASLNLRDTLTYKLA